MPCACQIPVPNYPETADWGPILWKILHGLAEKAGQGIIKDDETREWQKFIKITGEVLPCDICRAHYQTFLKANPTAQITTLPLTQLNNWVKSFFWNLHNQVNSSRGTPIYSYADLPVAYSKVDLTDLLYQLTPVVKKAIVLSGVPYMKWTAWISSFKMMRSVLAV
jgi:hypothetical protein